MTSTPPPIPPAPAPVQSLAPAGSNKPLLSPLAYRGLLIGAFCLLLFHAAAAVLKVRALAGGSELSPYQYGMMFGNIFAATVIPLVIAGIAGALAKRNRSSVFAIVWFAVLAVTAVGRVEGVVHSLRPEASPSPYEQTGAPSSGLHE